MEQIIETWVVQFQYIGMFFILSLGIVGLPLPDEILITFIGYQASLGKLSLLVSFMVTFFGSVLGICGSYALGVKYGLPLLQKYGSKFRLSERKIKQTQQFYIQYGPFFVTLGYFIPGIRQLVGYLAGISRIRFRSFLIFACFGGFLWCALFLGLGYVLGGNWVIIGQMLSSYGGYFSVGILFLFVGGFLYWRMFKLLGEKVTNKGAKSIMNSGMRKFWKDISDNPQKTYTYSTIFLYIYVTATGASVMALELAASRFLAPYFGTSMIVWANIIGLILFSLSLGYFIGGHLADRHPDGRILMLITLSAGVWSSALPLWGHFIFRYLSAGILGTPIFTILISFLAILLVFAPPVFLLAMVSPFAIRLVAVEPQVVGKISGKLYAFSTLGSLVGTFGTAFGTIPFWGTRETLFFWSAILIAISAWGLRHVRMGRFVSLFLMVPVFFYLWFHGPVKSGKGVLWSKDTLYQFAQVIREPDGSTTLVYNEGGGIQSIRRPHDALSATDYYDDYLILPYLVSRPKDILVLGSAGGTIPRLLAKYDKPFFPQLSVTGVEIDPDIIPLDYKYFGLKPEDAKIVNQDARVFLNHTSKRYDIIIVDAYSQQIYIPFHLSTVEFFRDVRSKLQPDGIVALNVNATTPDSKLLVSMEKTVHTVFPYTYILKARGLYNYVLLGSMNPLNINQLGNMKVSGSIQPILDEWQNSVTQISEQQMRNGLVLTDNRAPVEMMTDSMIFQFVRK
ncbi:fused MFS/spermidine synthase [Fodinisporobacter ferrooxydans]|uniref:Fused MFS/spermidine synthase n=1 Tax=Fodinisporobacter ferrooxydans TaxID=2901836 RepID=A0ABY4CPJ4_9BACL|nr:fused MFS/spermidine synthase [Alicyclobacillaceae bacterium MYW30-H2]